VDGDSRRKKHSCPIGIPGYRTMASLDRFTISRVICPENPGSMNPALTWVRSPFLPREDFPSNRADSSVGRVTDSMVLPRIKSPGNIQKEFPEVTGDPLTQKLSDR
jgi:hypothetical protein